MSVGTESRPLRVAVIGAGPAGFYVADHLFKQRDLVVEVDMYDRLPTPFGLVRHGVAPDHQKIKNVVKVFEKTAQHPRFRFYGHVEVGKHVMPADLRKHYHQVVYTVGAETDRNLGIPGEELAGSHSATEFVAWYNGHPDYRDAAFDLSQESVAVVGVGNVAVDVARVLARDPDELAETDIADYALEALRDSNVKEIHVLGRRGPAQAAFSLQELKELAKVEGCVVRTLAEEVELDDLTQAELDANPDRQVLAKVEVLQELAANTPQPDKKTMTIRFLVSPTELHDDGAGRVGSMTLVHNELYKDDRGSLRPRASDRTEQLDCGLVFRSVGYHGVPLADIPFHEKWGVIHNEKGRVIDPDSKQPILGEYTSGWIKRGPTGLIGTNKACAVETVECMLEDCRAGKLLDPTDSTADVVGELVAQRQPDHFTYADWQALDAHETERGKQGGRPRVKLTSISQMLEARNAPVK